MKAKKVGEIDEDTVRLLALDIEPGTPRKTAYVFTKLIDIVEK